MASHCNYSRVVIVFGGGEVGWQVQVWVVAVQLDAWGNLFFALALSGALSGAVEGGRTYQREEKTRLQSSKSLRLAFQLCEDEGWSAKVMELAQRGLTLEALLQFYEDLPRQMLDFNPAKHLTRDVVRRVIIPLSSRSRVALVTITMDDKPTFPIRMVTHNWSNLFRDLMAAIIAEALEEDEFEQIANLLDWDVGTVQEWPRFLRIENMKAWRAEDVAEILAGIPDKAAFNAQL